jgi:hypothetical protein
VEADDDRPLSRAGKEVFLKSIIQALPTFSMSCFQIPVATCTSLRRSIADFWWGFEDVKKKMHWWSREWLSAPKSSGGFPRLGAVELGDAW